MRFKKIKRIGIGFLSIVLLGGLAWSAENMQQVGSLAMPLTQEGGTARAMSMGSAVVGVSTLGSASLFWNPAGLGLMYDCMELGLHHNSGLIDTMQETVVIGMPMGSLGGFAAALNYVNNGTFEGRDAIGNQTGSYTAGDMGATVGWGKEWIPGLSAGVSVKYNKQTLAGTSYSATAGDLGLLWNPFERLNLGLTYSNIGTNVADSILDSGWRVGAAYDISKDLLLAASSDLNRAGLDRLQVGVESLFTSMLAFRVGYMYNFTDSQLDGLTGFTAGLGIKIAKNLMFDYAYLPYGDLGVSQRLSLTYKFLCKKKPVPVAAPVQPAPVTEVKAAPPVVVPPKPAPVVEPVTILEKLITLEDTHFEFDSATLTIEGAKIVIENTRILKDNPEAKIRVAGYTSCSGTVEYNQKLSERRAEAVRAILINVGGVSADRITTIGYGATRPAQFEEFCNIIDSKAAKANMRVLFEIMTK